MFFWTVYIALGGFSGSQWRLRRQAMGFRLRPRRRRGRRRRGRRARSRRRAGTRGWFACCALRCRSARSRAVAGLSAPTLVRTFTLPIAGLSIGSLSVNGTKVTMENPKLTGGRPDGSNYVHQREQGDPGSQEPHQVDLIDIVGDIGARDQSPTKLQPRTAIMTPSPKSMQLSGVVRLKNTNYTVDLKSAEVDFKTNVYVTHEPINVVTSSGMTDSRPIRRGPRTMRRNCPSSAM